ncbi:hypothetical protein [Streptomyces chattanoogensis]|uniref:hypothetical protein n=1 Tax=Streptomyces chattanoogensis TaxID=66876 RepID=UPI0036BFF1A5
MSTVEDSYPLTHIVWVRWIGLREVSEENWRKVYTRAVQVQTALGPGAMEITPELVRRHIGQPLGAYQLSDAAFRKQLSELFGKRLARELKQWEDRQSTDATAIRPAQ